MKRLGRKAGGLYRWLLPALLATSIGCDHPAPFHEEVVDAADSGPQGDGGEFGSDGDGVDGPDQQDAELQIEESFVQPTITSRMPTVAAEEVTYSYSVTCRGSLGDSRSLAVDFLDTCLGSIQDRGDGNGLYSFTPAIGQGGSTCNAAILCRNQAGEVRQSASILVVGVPIQVQGRYQRIGPLAYPGLLERSAVVFLPLDYDTDPNRRFGVLYLHDGQNLFDPAQAAFGVEWQVDETLDALTMEGTLDPMIVVGIENTAERIADYTPDADPDFGGGKGALYADFIVDLLKPVIDARFRTLSQRHGTAVGGSSLGGLISLYLAMRHPQVFGQVAVVSPSLWWNQRSLMSAFANFQGELPERLWLDIGTMEDEEAGQHSNGLIPYFVQDCRTVRDAALAKGLVIGDTLGYLEDPLARHNETAWAKRLDSILWFLFSSSRPAQPSDLRMFVYNPHLALDEYPQTTLAIETRHLNRWRLTWPNQAVTFISTRPDVASVDGTGLVLAIAVGESNLDASLNQLNTSQNITVAAHAQSLVAFEVHVPANTPNDATVHLTGSLTQLGPWDPAGLPLTRLDANRWGIQLNVPWFTAFEYKFTRGSWATVEKNQDGTERPNRSTVVTQEDLSLSDTVEAWADLLR